MPLALSAASCPSGVASLDGRAPLTFAQLQHSTISTTDAQLGSVRWTSQDRDGFIWLTTDDGVFRFDGVAFDQPLKGLLKPYNAPFVLLLGDDRSSNDMWVGHRRAGVTHIKDGRAVHYEGGSYPNGTTFSLFRDLDGVLWSATTGGVARFINGAWSPLPASMGWAKPHPGQLEIDRSTGTIYADDADLKGLKLVRGASRFVPAPLVHVLRAGSGLPPGTWGPPLSFSNVGAVLMSDHTLWNGARDGISRSWLSGDLVASPLCEEHFTVANGLSNRSVQSFIEDAEGDVWAGTDDGLDRFRKPHFIPQLFSDSLHMPSMARDRSGNIWVAEALSFPFRVTPSGDVVQIQELLRGASTVASAPDGSVWFAGLNGVRRWKDGAAQFVKLPPELVDVERRFLQLAVDASGSLWTHAHTFGLYKYDGSAWTKQNGLEGFLADTPLFVQGADDGAIWVTYSSGEIMRWQNGHAATVARLHGESPLMLTLDDERIWVGTDKGLVLVKDGTQRRLRVQRGGGLVDVTGITRGTDGSLWVSSRSGIDRIRPAAVEKFIGQFDDHVESDFFDRSEGVGQNIANFFSTPSLLTDVHGYIWHTAQAGVSAANPDLISLNRIPPKPVIIALTFEGRTEVARPDLVLPALTQSLQIDYTAPMLRRPEHGRFEYRLEGVDDQWQAAGTRRSAFYTRLSPGTYTFRVRAFNEDGVASASDAAISFQIAPAWFETAWFRGLCVGIALALVALGFRLRLNAVSRRIKIRHDERERIARDLHDTLLQSVQGLVLRFQSVRRVVTTSPNEAVAAIDRAMEIADLALTEGREKVSSLRQPSAQNDLAEALAGVMNHVEADGVQFEIRTRGAARRLSAAAFEDIYFILREAAANAFAHGHARKIVITLSYGRWFRGEVADDGMGFDVNVARPGHWGVLGMHERARNLRADLKISSRQGSGSTVTVKVRGRRVYL